MSGPFSADFAHGCGWAHLQRSLIEIKEEARKLREMAKLKKEPKNLHAKGRKDETGIGMRDKKYMHFPEKIHDSPHSIFPTFR